jgi:hypothetical protein
VELLKITCFFERGMPSPVSSTSMRSRPRRRRRPTSTRPLGVYLIAFETRFSRAGAGGAGRISSAHGAKSSLRPFSSASGELDLELAHELVDAETR